MQSDESIKDCQFIEAQQPLLARVERPCCDVITYVVDPGGTQRRVGKLSCIQNLRELSEIQYKPEPEDAQNKSSSTDVQSVGDG
jgi:hypothetical protein